ncbi:MAG TPA: hypothetical protein VH016_20250, partial [Actinomycetota bacterium]|nr:hypothetical protein [Actinomycetota bacterium]
MSIRDGLEPSRSQDSETHTQPLPRDQVAPTPNDPATSPAGEPWPPSWGEAPASWGQAPAAPGRPQPPAPGAGPSWTQPKAAQGPSWTQASGNDSPGASWPPPPRNDAPGPPRTRLTRDDGPGDSTGAQPPAAEPGWGQGGGGHPATPAWGAPPADAGSPRGRRPSRWLAGVLAGAVLLAAGFGISQALDNDAEPAGAGIPAAGPAPVAAPIAPSGEEPAAAVAKALLPTVVEIR